MLRSPSKKGQANLHTLTDYLHQQLTFTRSKAQSHLSSFWESSSPQRAEKFLQQSNINYSPLSYPLHSKEAQHILGLFMFWKQHIPHISLILCPVYAITWNSATFHWDEAQQCALEAAQQTVQEALLLIPPGSTFQIRPHLTMPPGVSGPNRNLPGFLWGFELTAYLQWQPEYSPWVPAFVILLGSFRKWGPNWPPLGNTSDPSSYIVLRNASQSKFSRTAEAVPLGEG